jgi:hypothetical protein
MTLHEPTLQLDRLVVKADNHTAYDERFHRGLNIVRGENSSGKSTIMNMIFYALGGDLSDWSDAALQCTRVFCEVSFNGKKATLSREISRLAGRPMDIYGGPYDAAVKAPLEAWTRYPYRSAGGRQSFSKSLFQFLNLPEVHSESSGNITMHQVLRLLYADQLSPVESIFRHEAFDSGLTREAVGRLLCGAFDNKIYGNVLRTRELDKEFSEIEGELRSLSFVLSKIGESLTLEMIDAEAKNLADERNMVAELIENAEESFFRAGDEDRLTLDAQQKSYAEVQELQTVLFETKKHHDKLKLDIDDSELFIAHLEEKLAALGDAAKVAELVGEATFSVCPSCYAPIEEAHDHKTCHLCKSAFDPKRASSRLLSIINDTGLQLQQSRVLQAARKRRLQSAMDDLVSTEAKWRSASERFSALKRLPSTYAQEELRKLQRRAGYLDKKSEELTERAKSITKLVELSRKKETISAEISKLKSEAESARIVQSHNLREAAKQIETEIRNLLHNDLRRQDSFENANSIQFDFSKNTISVDDASYFSASSRAILRTSFFFGFFVAAARKPLFRHPRFCLIDNIEDKGVEPDRSRNFQNLVSRISASLVVDHQIILATAMISPDLDPLCQTSCRVFRIAERGGVDIKQWLDMDKHSGTASSRGCYRRRAQPSTWSRARSVSVSPRWSVGEPEHWRHRGR